MHVVDRDRLGDDLGLVVVALREEGPDRTVDHAGGQGRLLARPRLAAEERAGDLAGRVVLLLNVDGEWKEVHVADVADGRGAEHHRVAARTTTAPPACRANLPVSKEIS